MNFLRLLKNPKAFIRSKADEIAEQKIRQQNYIPITETQENDIFIASYPKSGVTWMQHLISSIIYGINSFFLPDKLVQELIPDVYSKKYYKRFLDFAVFKMHDLPKPQYKKVIHLVRDGRDAMCSYYAMNKSLKMKVSFDEMLYEEKGIMFAWKSHCEKWIENPYNANIIDVRYEDLISSPVVELQKICDFIGIKRDVTIIEQAVNGNEFSQMQKKEMIYGWDNQNWDSNERFVRKGKVGNYKEEMTKKQIDFFNKKNFHILNTYNYGIESNK